MACIFFLLTWRQEFLYIFDWVCVWCEGDVINHSVTWCICLRDLVNKAVIYTVYCGNCWSYKFKQIWTPYLNLIHCIQNGLYVFCIDRFVHFSIKISLKISVSYQYVIYTIRNVFSHFTRFAEALETIMEIIFMLHTHIMTVIFIYDIYFFSYISFIKFTLYS